MGKEQCGRVSKSVIKKTNKSESRPETLENP